MVDFVFGLCDELLGAFGAPRVKVVVELIDLIECVAVLDFVAPALGFILGLLSERG